MTLHNLEIRIATDMTLEQVEILKDHLFECITSCSDICPGLEDLDIRPESVDLIVVDSQ